MYDEFIQKLTQNSNINFSKNKTNMKQKFYSILLTALMGLFGMNAWADDYQIATAQDLVDFATAVNGGETGANAVLTANINMTGKAWDNPIGVSGYQGHFDGQGYTISGLEYTTNQDNHGLFGKLNAGAVVENFTIYGDIENISYDAIAVVGYTTGTTIKICNIISYLNLTNSGNDKKIGGILGNGNNGTTNVDRCAFFGTIETTDKANVGGISGYIQNNTSTYVNFSNCLFDGKITTVITTAYCGGIVGYIGKSNTRYTVKNCLSLGTIEAPVAGNIIGYARNKGGGSSNNYILSGGKTYGKVADNCAATDYPATEVTAEQLASGEIAFKLNGDQSDINWFQKLKNTVFIAQQYVATVNGTPRDPQTANATMTEDGNGTYTFLLPDFVVHTNSMDIPAGDVKLEEVEITDEGTFNKDGLFSVPDENIPASMAALKPYLQNINYTLSGKVNGDKLYATITGLSIEIPMLGTYNISVEIGEDNFTAAAPTGEAFPKPYGTAIVYGNGSFNCDMTPKAGTDIVYSNTDASIIDPHSFTDGFCTVCGTLDEAWLTANGEGYFEIANEKQLVWFAAYVNNVSYAASAVLTADIDMTNAGWPNPIGDWATGNVSSAYKGHFDGQGFAITNLNYTADKNYHGFFGVVTEGAVIENFSISGEITSNTQYVGVVAYARETPIIRNIHSHLNIITNTNSSGRQGGIVGGSMNGTVTIDRCYYSGTLNAGELTGNYGGIVGYVNNNPAAHCNISNCLFDGKLNNGTATGQCGGIVGYNNGGYATLTNCLSIGSLVSGSAGQLFGALNGNNSTYQNCYYAGIAPQTGSGTPNGDTPVEVTAAQLASGEVAYKLGAAWSQLLGTDNTPVLGTDAPVSYVGDAGYATLYDTTTGYTLNGDVKAFVAVLNTSWLDLNEIDNIPAGTPVVLKGNYYNKLAADLPAINVANNLKGTDADTVADGTMYILANGSNGVGFYQATTGSTIAAGKAYYQSTSGVKAFFFDGDDATGIADLKDLKDSKDLIYNLAGQRLGKMQRGINIVGGKKVLR